MRSRVLTAIAVSALALLALLLYSLERTAWLFQRFEAGALQAYAAALVVELTAVALIVGASALAGLERSAQAWANRALVAVLSVQALANLSVGYIRGGASTLAAFGSDRSAFAVAATLWLATNLAVPALILCISKLLERLLIALPERAPTAPTITIEKPTAPALPSAPTKRALAGLTYYDDSGAPRFPCPRCGAALTSGRAIGAAKTNGGCRDCRGRIV